MTCMKNFSRLPHWLKYLPNLKTDFASPHFLHKLHNILNDRSHSSHMTLIRIYISDLRPRMNDLKSEGCPKDYLGKKNK